MISGLPTSPAWMIKSEPRRVTRAFRAQKPVGVRNQTNGRHGTHCLMLPNRWFASHYAVLLIFLPSVQWHSHPEQRIFQVTAAVCVFDLR